MEAGNRDEDDRLAGLGAGAHHFESQSADGRHHIPIHKLQPTQNPHFPPDYPQIVNRTHCEDSSITSAEAVPLHLRSASLASYAANNQHAATANANHAISQSAAALNGVVDSDLFYTTYRTADASDPELMASSSTLSHSQRQKAAASSLRSNGNGTTPKHPAIAPTTRTGPKPTTKSAATPTDDVSTNARSRVAAYGSSQPSVKDLKRRFDQNATAQATNAGATTRKAAPRNSSREPSSASSQTSTATTYRGVGSAKPSTGGPAPSSPIAGTRSSQRSRVTLEDHVSNNPQSFASRISKPRGASNGLSSKSMSSLSSAPNPNTTSVPPVPQPNKTSSSGPGKPLLFGEILPGGNDLGAAGFGIDSVRHRSGSESNLQSPTTISHQRNLSHSDASPTSPDDWYRDGNRAVNENTSVAKLQMNHNRSQSDGVGTKSTLTPGTTPRASDQQRSPPTRDLSTSTGTSKIPVSVKRHSPSSSASPPYSRPSSPATLKRPPTRTQEHGVKSPPTKTSATSSRENTPTNRKRPAGIAATNGNTRLNAYISAPPPKLSPPLRSSRPRQPVSSATTASSRMKAAERGRSPHRTSESNRRRKISMGPIDFNARREQIKLSYTKSIRESEIKAAARRREAIERERKQREEEEDEAARAAAIAAREAQAVIIETATPSQAAEHLELPRDSSVGESAQEQAVEGHREQPEQLTLVCPTNIMGQPIVETPAVVLQLDADSPTLGIPGSFPPMDSPEVEYTAPPSAASDTTEFDNEPQTEPPIPQTPLSPDNAGDGVGEVPLSARAVSEYKSPFDELSNEGSPPMQIGLDVAVTPSIKEPTSTITGLNIISDGQTDFHDDEYVPQPFVAPSQETTVTIISRNSDFSPAPKEAEKPVKFQMVDTEPERESTSERNPMSSPPRLNRHISQSRETASSDDCSDQDASLNKLEEFFIGGPNVADSAARLRDSTSFGSIHHSRTWSMEHTEQAHTGLRFSTETGRTMETRPSLNVPRTSSSANRTSQNTVWTDYSVESREASPEFPGKEDAIDYPYRESGSTSDAAQSYPYEHSLRAQSPTPEASPHGSYRSPRPSQEARYLFSEHQLPELDTGEGFVVDYITRKNSTAFVVPVLPDHSPPPPPEEATFPDLSSAPTSEYLNDTRPSSYLHGAHDGQSSFSMSRPQSESFENAGSTPLSVDQGSIEASEAPASSRTRIDSQTTLAETLEPVDNSVGASAKERKRLFTRLETIKELVDTESFFIRDMNIVEEIYKGTAEACPKLDDNTIKLIFRNTDQIIAFHTAFLAELKEGVASVYTPKVHRSVVQREVSGLSDASAGSTPAMAQLDDGKDRETSLGPAFKRNIEKMKTIHETFLKNSDHAAKRLIQIQEDPTVKVWLNECNEVARDLTKAWNLDSLLIKPMQRITKYPNLLIQLLHETPLDHPDRPGLESAKAALEDAIEEINKTKRNFELVGQIVGRKRKESDSRSGFARAFGKRVDKLQSGSNREPEDAEYLKLHEKFGDDYLRLQVVLRDVEFYTRQVSAYVHEFLQYLSSMELVMRLQPSPHPELESKWVRFNVSMRDIEKVALEQHLSQVRKQVIEPFEQVIKAYSNPSLAMKKRTKRRLDYERSTQLRKAGKKLDKQLAECVEQYDALNEALKKELPKLSALTEKVGNICLANFVNIQAQWFSIWKEKVKVVLDSSQVPGIPDIISAFQRDYKYQDEQVNSLSIVNPAYAPRPSQSTSIDEPISKIRSRPSELSTARARGLSINSDIAPSLPTPDFAKRRSGQFVTSPSMTSIPPSPHHYYYRDYYSGIHNNATTSASTLNNPPETRPRAASSVRPGTGHSYDSNPGPRQSSDSNAHIRRHSNLTQQSPPESSSQRFSGLFHSALPPSDGFERSTRPSRASSRASSRERPQTNGYNVLWLAASLFEFNIETTKHEAGYPYLTYQAGEIFDVIAEKGELWLAKNQDDPRNVVGWLWSKHFAKLADD
ncbi:hypothetical protein BX600DRAFT_507907 [Xylariales sp. PMI_506]|nr:hypothetical protein BX600DRAFT_507907 [Xylariales sp. PMI_506]